MTPVRIQVLSDLHAELAPGSLPDAAACRTDADLVVLVGDIARAPDSAAVARQLFPDAPYLVLVAGNHEHYGTGLSIDAGMTMLRAGAARL